MTQMLETVTLVIDDLSHDGRGVARLDGKVHFVDFALPGETVTAKLTKKRKDFNEATTVEVLDASPVRVPAKCPHFQVCGGCAMQHVQESQQLIFKQGILERNLSTIGKVTPERWLSPLASPKAWGYRHKARIGVKFVQAKEKVLVGFREKQGRFIVDAHVCPILPEPLAHLFVPLGELVQSLSIFQQVPQIEVAVGEGTTILIFRILSPLTSDDTTKMIDFAKEHNLVFYIQEKGPSSIRPLYPETPTVSHYMLEDLRLEFLPWQFTQVNPYMNEKMVAQALELLELQPTDNVLDLFCGIGNFTLPMARRAHQVFGLEGDEGAVKQAIHNAALNNVKNCAFEASDLTKIDHPFLNRSYDKILIDPPRCGADALMPVMAQLGAQKIVYVSCHPGSLARDAGILSQHGYRLVAAGAMDMFPHTAHVESMVLFEKEA